MPGYSATNDALTTYRAFSKLLLTSALMNGRFAPDAALGGLESDFALLPKADSTRNSRRVRKVPLPDSCIAANCASFDHLVGTGERGLLGQPCFAEPLHQQLRV